MSVGFINTHRRYPEAPADFVNPDYVMPPMTIPDTKENRKDMADFMYSAKIADDCVGTVLEALKNPVERMIQLLFYNRSWDCISIYEMQLLRYGNRGYSDNEVQKQSFCRKGVGFFAFTD